MPSKVINRHVGIPEQPRKGAVRCTGARRCVGARSHSSRKPFRVGVDVTAGGEVAILQATVSVKECSFVRVLQTLQDVSGVE